MRRYALKRLLATIPLLFGITFVCFILVYLMPSDPAEVVLCIRQTPVITDEAVHALRAELGLDAPFLVRYAKWLGNLLKFDLGVSYVNPARTVTGELLRALPATLKLTGMSLFFVVCLSLPIGFFSAAYQNSVFDRAVRGGIFLITATPAYWLGLLLIWLFSLRLNLFPTSGIGGWQHLILPSLTVSMGYVAIFVRLIRSNMLDNMKKDYVLYAHARGLSSRNILCRHVLKNSLQPCVTAFGMSIPEMIAGTIVVENVFSWPGLGSLCVSAIANRDYPVIQAYVLLIGTLFVIFNLLFDMLQYASDPRLSKS